MQYCEWNQQHDTLTNPPIRAAIHRHANKLLKTTWNDIKKQVEAVNPLFFELVESLPQPPQMPLYLASYAYGTAIQQKNNFYVPTSTGELLPLFHEDCSNDVLSDLNYAKNCGPLSMILDHVCESCYQEAPHTSDFPIEIHEEGALLNQTIIFEDVNPIENNPITLFSGAKSIFMLPYIGCQTRHARLKNSLHCTNAAPKSPAEHYDLFTELIKNQSDCIDWSSTLLLFSHAWVEKIKTDPQWMALKLYFSENQRKKLAADLYNPAYNDLFMTISAINRFRPTPFLVDSAKYLFRMMMKKGIGYKPATDEKMLPLRCIQEAYNDDYQLTYTPTIMVPGLLEEHGSIYYSLQHPSPRINTFKNKMNNSTYRELVALKNILLSLTQLFAAENGPCYGSDLYHACREVSFHFFHHKPSDPNDQIKPSSEIIHYDPRYEFTYGSPKAFSVDAKFFRGCIQISKAIS